jgi:phenylalanyl-tRNA synthetase beta chain
MKIPLSWIKDFVDVDQPVVQLAKNLTMAGLEVEEIHYVGLPLPAAKGGNRPDGRLRPETKITGIAWDPDKIVVGAVLEVMPHPNADRLVLCRLDDGRSEQVVLTGAPNLFPYTGQGPLAVPIKVAYAREGARLYDGHQPGQVMMTLQRARIRGVESYSMACSEKELGISDEHEGIIFLDEHAPVGMPLVEYMGDAVLDIAILPNLGRDTNVLGVAREIAVITGAALKENADSLAWVATGPAIEGAARIVINEPQLNPRFVLGLIRDVRIGPSPYEVQRRLRLAGMRPINNIVDATNYAMLELGEPLHAFDYDVLVQRAGGTAPTILTRTAHPGERLLTLDEVDRPLDDFTVLVCDTAGPLSIAGVMGGAESEVSQGTRNVLLEGAAWNYINIRRTLVAQRMTSEAAYRFSRGVHPAMASRGVRRGLELMHQWAGGVVSQGLIDNYPLPPTDPAVEVTPLDVRRWLGISLQPDEIADILRRLEFKVGVVDGSVRAVAPDHRLDIGEGTIGVADVLEEIARIYGYDRMPETRLADSLPPPHANLALDREERLRDLLVNLGIQEVLTYRMTSPEREARLLPAGTLPLEVPYLRLANPIASDRVVMRRSLLSAVLEVVERNARLQERLALFEIASVYWPVEGQLLPNEPLRLVIVLAGPRNRAGWQPADSGQMDFYDLKGIVDSFLEGLHVGSAAYSPADNPSYHPGKSARLTLDGVEIGVMGELHPLVRENYDLPGSPLLAADFDASAILSRIPEKYAVHSSPAYPPVLEDLAIVVDAAIPAEQVTRVIRQAGGDMLSQARLFDVYQGEQIERGLKSLAYSLAYQAPDRTLTDVEAAQIRGRILRSLAQELHAILRA